jgi:ubiquinone/menaquinone biosynthesis C-methylase UbiE
VEEWIMSSTAKHDAWNAGQSYERYMGRWSREIAARYLDWLEAPENADWADIGSGTGALTQTILDRTSPRSVSGIEPSEGFVAHARETIRDGRTNFTVGDAQKLPLPADSVDVSASGLVLNFVPDKTAALKEMQRITRPGGLVSFYVWDYPGGGMGFIDVFWKAAAEFDPAAKDLDEGKRFPFCTGEGLTALCNQAGLSDVVVEPIRTETVFSSFEDFWQPFTLGAGPAPGYCMSLDDAARTKLKQALKSRVDTGGKVALPANAWGIKAVFH